MNFNSFDPSSNSCLFCGSEKIVKFTTRGHDYGNMNDININITECSVCYFAWQFPLPNEEWDSVKYFEWAKGQSDYFDLTKKRKSSELKFSFVADLHGAGNYLLDLGAGIGSFAEVAADSGWQVTAVDPVLDVDRLSKYANINAIRGSIDSITDKMVFDVVTMWDVIEHITDPIEIISKVRCHLKDGGWLVIETGNYKSADRIGAGDDAWIYQAEHKWYFSPEPLLQLLKNSGFKEFRFSERVLNPKWKGSSNYCGPSRSDLVKRIINNPFRFPAHISRHLALLKARQWEMGGLGAFAIAAKKQ